MTTPAASSSSSELSDYESSSDLEIFMIPKKLKDELEKELEKDLEIERKAAAEKGEPSYNDGSAVQIGSDGRVRSARVVRLERIMKARKTMRAQVVQNIAKHLQKPYVRKAFDILRCDIPPANALWSFREQKKISIMANEDGMCIKIARLVIPY